MKFQRERWTPLTVTIETPEEAEVLHKILAVVSDETEERDGLYSLFAKLGEGLDSDNMKFRVTGSVELYDK